MIAGYNTVPDKEKENYDKKKLCRTIGGGMAVLDIFTILQVEFEEILPSCFTDIIGAAMFADIVIMLIFASTFCRS